MAVSLKDPEVLVYGVWRPGKGWLRAKNPKTGQYETFRTTLMEIAEGAVQMLHAKALIRPLDDSLEALESEFLTLEAEALAAKQRKSFRWPFAATLPNR